MALPIVAAITREVLATVPREQQEAAYALGATRWEMVRGAMLPWARSGIVGACALGLGRAVGETIAIALLLGNSPNIFGSLLQPGATLASVLALEFGEASNLQLSALIALSVILFVLSFAVNAAARLLVRRWAAGPGPVRRLTAAWRVRRAAAAPEEAPPPPPRPAGPADAPPAAARWPPSPLPAAATAMVYLALAVPSLDPARLHPRRSWWRGCRRSRGSFFTELPPADPYSTGGISSALVGTLILMALATVVAAPIRDPDRPVHQRRRPQPGAAAPHRRGGRLHRGRAPGDAVDRRRPRDLPGVVVAMGHFSALAGGIALGLIMFPIVVGAADEILRLVPDAQKEAALALGAPRGARPGAL